MSNKIKMPEGAVDKAIESVNNKIKLLVLDFESGAIAGETAVIEKWILVAAKERLEEIKAGPQEPEYTWSGMIEYMTKIFMSDREIKESVDGSDVADWEYNNEIFAEIAEEVNEELED